MMFLKPKILLLLVFASSLLGCAKPMSINLDELDSYLDATIHVTLCDGRVFQFDGGDYSIIVREDGTKAIHGKARAYVGDMPQFSTYEGDLAFQEI
jgi:hypothetical protein